MRNFCVTGLIFAVAFGSVACSSKDNPAGSSDAGLGKGGATGGGVVDGGCVDPSQVFDGVSKCLPKTEAVNTCKTSATTAQPGTKIDDPTCGAGCTCEQCTSQMLACANDPLGYCPTILTCAQAKNCTGAGCYTAATCMGVIDMAPPCSADGKCDSYNSISVALAGSLSDCATKTAKFMGRDGTTCAAACP